MWADKDVEFLKNQPVGKFDMKGFLGERLAAAKGIIALPEGHAERLKEKEKEQKKQSKLNDKDLMDVDIPAAVPVVDMAAVDKAGGPAAVAENVPMPDKEDAPAAVQAEPAVVNAAMLNKALDAALAVQVLRSQSSGFVLSLPSVQQVASAPKKAQVLSAIRDDVAMVDKEPDAAPALQASKHMQLVDSSQENPAPMVLEPYPSCIA